MDYAMSHSWTVMQPISHNSISQSNRQFDRKSSKRYSMILRRHILQKSIGSHLQVSSNFPCLTVKEYNMEQNELDYPNDVFRKCIDNIIHP